MLEHEELDAMLQIMENPVRRKIIKRLSQEPCYALQLSKELGFGQPLVAKHLGVMEQAGLVTTTAEASPAGPKRKRYALGRSVSITMHMAPNLFLEKGVVTTPGHAKSAKTRAATVFGKRVNEATESGDDRKSLLALSGVLHDVDERIGELEEERTELLDVRDRAMRGASRIASGLGELDKRRVLLYVLDEHDVEVERISESLNLREFTVRAILEELERDYLG